MLHRRPHRSGELYKQQLRAEGARAVKPDAEEKAEAIERRLAENAARRKRERLDRGLTLQPEDCWRWSGAGVSVFGGRP